jgi:hypothetical protein
MRRVLLLVVVLTAAIVPTTAGPAVAGNRYRAYVACGLGSHAEPSHVCDRQGRKAAFFLSKDADVTYRVCVKYPEGQRLCASHQDAPEDELQVNEITSNQRGRHKVTWYVDGGIVATWRFRNKNLG